jgi:hypothetical protein
LFEPAETSLAVREYVPGAKDRDVLAVRLVLYPLVPLSVTLAFVPVVRPDMVTFNVPDEVPTEGGEIPIPPPPHATNKRSGIIAAEPRN